MLFLLTVINQIYMNGDMSTMLLVISIVGIGRCCWGVIKGSVVYDVMCDANILSTYFDVIIFYPYPHNHQHHHHHHQHTTSPNNKPTNPTQ